MAKPDRLVALHALGSELVQQVHLSLRHTSFGCCSFIHLKTELVHIDNQVLRLFRGYVTWLRIPKKLYGLLGPGVRVASTQTKE